MVDKSLLDCRFRTVTLRRKRLIVSVTNKVFLFFNCCFTPSRGSKTLLLCKSRGQAVQVPLWKLPEVGSSRGAAEPDHSRQVRTGHLPACWCGESGGGRDFARMVPLSSASPSIKGLTLRSPPRMRRISEWQPTCGWNRQVELQWTTATLQTSQNISISFWVWWHFTDSPYRYCR